VARIRIPLLIFLVLSPFVVGSKGVSDPPSPQIYALIGVVESESKKNVSGLTVFLECPHLNTFDDTNGHFYKEFGDGTAITRPDEKFVIRDTSSSCSYSGVGWEIFRVRVVSKEDTIKGSTIFRDSGKYISLPSREVGCGSTSRTLPSQEVYIFINKKVTIP
jgi:hypothetical protein